MTKYVALLRGINVGGRTIKKDELIACFESAGYTDVHTVIQSGNVLFTSSDTSPLKLTDNIEKVLSDTFAYDAKAFVLKTETLANLIEATPYKTDSPDEHSYVIFMADNLEQELVNDATDLEGEAVKAGDGVVYWRVKKGLTLKSKVGKLTAKSKYREHLTNRNLNTLKKIVAL